MISPAAVVHVGASLALGGVSHFCEARLPKSGLFLPSAEDVELVIDDAAAWSPLLQAEPERLPHVHARRLDPLPLSADQLATKEFVQRLLLPFLAKPQRLAGPGCSPRSET